MRLLSVASFVVFVSFASTASAARIDVAEDAFVDLRLLLQLQAQVEEDGAPDGKSLGKDLFLRRGRIVLSGQLGEKLSFFFDTDAVNYGRDDFSADVFVQDAFFIYTFGEALRVDGGMMYPPLLRHTNQAAPSLLALDFHSTAIRFPAFSNRFMRDVGLQARGLLFEQRIQYRAGVFRGVRGLPSGDAEPRGAEGLNPEDALRFAGSLRYNFFEAEPDFYYSGISFNKKRVLSVGVGGDWQRDAVRDASGALDDYVAFGADLYLDLPLPDDQEVVVQVNFTRWENGEDAPNTGIGTFAEVGWRFGAFSPIASYERFEPDDDAFEWADAARLTGAWWLRGHAANLKLELANLRPGGATDERHWQATLQSQIFF